MAKFTEGDKVRVTKGIYEGESGVVVDAWWQISQSDWPYVKFLKDDGSYQFVDEDSMELAEDPYEYASQATIHGEVQQVASYDWATLEVAQERVDRYTEIWSRNGHGTYITAKVVKRRKAGKVEDV